MLFPPVLPGALARNTTSAQLDGAGFFAMGSMPATSGAITLEGWVFLRAHQDWQKVVEVSSNGSDGAYIAFNASGQPFFHIMSGTSIVGGTISGSPVPLNTWTHVAAIGGTGIPMALYVNGVLVASNNPGIVLPSVVRTTSWIGKSSNAGHPLLNGSVADVRIWSTARTSAQIQASMTVGSVSGTTIGLVAAYPFGATGANALADVSGNNRTLTQQDTVQFDVGGPSTPSSSALFDGSGSLRMPSLPAMGGSVTLEGWVRLRSFASWGRLVEVGNAGGNDIIILAPSSGTSGKPHLTIITGGAYIVQIDAANAIPLNVWTHVAGVIDQDRTCRLYVNGQLVGSGTATALPANVTRSANFISKGSTDSGLDGSMADVRIWNTARTAAQIQASMPVGSVSAATTGLVAAYPFGATGAAPLSDVSGNNRTLTPSGPVLFNASGPSSPVTSSVNNAMVATLNGSGWYAMPSLPSLGTSPFGTCTLESWVYLTAHQDWQKVVDLSSNGADGVYITFSQGRPVFHVMSGGAITGGVMPDTPVPLNAWTHLAAVIRADLSMALYVNGALVKTSSGFIAPVNRSTCFIGKSSDAAHPLFAGSIADVRVWSVARTQAEIQASMPVGSITGATTGLVAAYPFGATGSGVLADVSGNSRTLTQSGSPQYQKMGPGSVGTSGIQGTASLRSLAGTLNLTGQNPFTGGVTVDAGTISLTGEIANNAGNTITVNNAGIFSIDRSDAFGNHATDAVTPLVINPGGVIRLGSGFWGVMGPITLRGGTLRALTPSGSGWSFALRGQVTVDGGATTSVVEGPGMALGATTVSETTFEVADGSAVDDLVVRGGLLNGPAQSWPNAQASGLRKTGSGRMILLGANTYSGTTTISAGTLQVGDGGTSGTLGSGNVANNATLSFNRSDTLAVANAISGTGTLVQSGAGTVTLSGANTYSGPTTVGAGTLALSGSGSLGTSSTITVAAGARLDASARTTALALASSQTLANSGGNALLSGNILAQAGTLSVVSDGSTPGFTVSGGTLTVGAGALVRLNKTGGALAAGSYRVIAKGTGGSVAGAPPGVQVDGGGLASGMVATSEISGGELFVKVAALQMGSASNNDNVMAAALNGLGWFAMPSLPALGSAITLETWVNPRSAGYWPYILNIGEGSLGAYLAIVLNTDTRRPALFVSTASPASPENWTDSITSSTAIPLNQWSHVAATIGSDRSLRLYLNGQLVASGTASASLASAVRNSNVIGRSPAGSNPYVFDGSLADVRVWSVARSQAEIQAAMSVGTITGATTGLVAAYPFGATGNTVLADVSGNGRHLSETAPVRYEKTGTGSLTSSLSDLPVSYR